jgi:phosphatidylserine/phosphatidylglycerophosphate/cardiolipin synthase-like enzyme
MCRLLSALLVLAAVGCNDDRVITLGPGPLPAEQTGPVRVYFTTPDKRPEDAEIVKALVGYINRAGMSIDVAAFELDNVVITDALVAAVRRGVKVRLVTETDYVGESGVSALKAVGVPVVDDQRPGALMHNKFMVFDRSAVWTGSMNFTENCAYHNNNHGVYIADARVAENYATKFAWMHERRKFGGLPERSARIPNPVVTLADGTRLENCFSTHDHIADKLTAKINAVEHRVHFLAFSFTHDGMGKAMLARAAAGAEVQGVFEKSQAAGGYSEYTAMRSAGGTVSVYLDANSRNMHHKVLILDDETVVCGSFNFSDGADRSNDENAIVVASKPLARRFEEEFQRVYGAAKRADSGQTARR